MSNRFEFPNNSAPCLTGYLLISAPQQGAEDFERTVCMVVHHGKKGAIGVHLNREFQNDAHDIWEHIVGVDKEYQDGLLHLGGPEAGPVVALHSSPKYAEFESGEGVFFAAQVQNLQALLHSELENTKIKILVGQAVWGPGELDQEFNEGKWAMLPVTPKVVFAEDQLMWKQAIRELGNRFVENAVGSNAPVDILFN